MSPVLLRALRVIWRDYRWLIVAVAAVWGVGTVFYSIVEDWSVLDSLYFSLVTLATIGYGDFTPKTTLGKIFTIWYIFVGVGLLALFIRTLGAQVVDEREARWRRRHDEDAAEPREDSER